MVILILPKKALKTLDFSFVKLNKNSSIFKAKSLQNCYTIKRRGVEEERQTQNEEMRSGLWFKCTLCHPAWR